MELWDRRIHLNKAVNGSTVEGGHSRVYFSAQSPLVHDSSLKKVNTSITCNWSRMPAHAPTVLTGSAHKLVCLCSKHGSIQKVAATQNEVNGSYRRTNLDDVDGVGSNRSNKASDKARSEKNTCKQ